MPFEVLAHSHQREKIAEGVWTVFREVPFEDQDKEQGVLAQGMLCLEHNLMLIAQNCEISCMKRCSTLCLRKALVVGLLIFGNVADSLKEPEFRELLHLLLKLFILKELK